MRLGRLTHGPAAFYAVRVPYCTVNGVRIHYDVSGEGFPLVLVHANPFNSRRGSEDMAGRIAGAVHRVVPATGHACCLEDPAAFDGYVSEFLEQHGYL